MLDLQNPAAVQQVSASVGSATTLNVSWDAASDDTTSGSALSYEVCASKSASCSINFQVSKEISNGATSVELTDLEPYQIYYLAVRAKDSFAKVSPVKTKVAETASLGTMAVATITPATAVFNESQQVAFNADSGTVCATSNNTQPACNRDGSCKTGQAVSSINITQSS